MTESQRVTWTASAILVMFLNSMAWKYVNPDCYQKRLSLFEGASRRWCNFFEGALIVLRCKIGKVLKCQSTYVSPSSYTFWRHKRNSFSFKENHNSISCSNIFLVQVFRFRWALAKVKAGLCFSRAGENFSWFCVNLLIKSGVWSGVEGMGWYGEGRRGDEGEEEEILFGEKSEQKSDEDLRNLFPA